MSQMGRMPSRLGAGPQRLTAPAKTADPFYHSPEYAAWRRAVIKRAGGKCQRPGCTYGGRLYADHIVERRDGGADLDLSNGQALCHTHHQQKTVAARSNRYAR